MKLTMGLGVTVALKQDFKIFTSHDLSQRHINGLRAIVKSVKYVAISEFTCQDTMYD